MKEEYSDHIWRVRRETTSGFLLFIDISLDRFHTCFFSLALILGVGLGWMLAPSLLVTRCLCLLLSYFLVGSTLHVATTKSKFSS